MRNKKNWVLDIAFLLIVIVATFYGVFHGQDLTEIKSCLYRADTSWWYIGAAVVVGYILCEAYIFYFAMRPLQSCLKYLHCLLFSCIGFFFTLITPMDFDDLIYNTVLLLENYPEVREYYQRKFRYVLIDEYQDTNNLQYRLAAALAGKGGNLCVVGDDDQSIYKFRGATIENILSFEQEFKNARVIRLEQNYRSTGNILGAANAVIRNNTERTGKELWTEQDVGEKLTLYVAQNENDEAQYVAQRILDNFSAGVNWRENAVLYRMTVIAP